MKLVRNPLLNIASTINNFKNHMTNKWKISKKVEDHVRERDSHCVYCGIDFSMNHISRKTKPTWEHIVNDMNIMCIENIALCCTSCNASKGSKQLELWLESQYCVSKVITKESVSQVIKDFLKTTSN
jgi:DNA-directed RNA polymerase subunit RPC12/RpoP